MIRTTRKEIIEMLKVLKEQALKSHNDTAIIDVKKDSFIYVMNVAINSLEIDERYELEYENAEEIHREKEQAYMQGYEDASKKYRKEPCGDAVSRRAINNLRKYILVGGISTVSLIDVNKMPSVNPQEPNTGRWIKISPADIYECSECGQNVMTADICAYRYCHGCGAKMAESERSDAGFN